MAKTAQKAKQAKQAKKAKKAKKARKAVGRKAPRKPSRVFLVVVDDSAEMPLALHYACNRAAKTRGTVALLSIIDNSAEFQHWLGVGDLHRIEMKNEARTHLKELSSQVVELTGKQPITYIREGERGPELYALLEEEESIQVVVVAAGTSTEGPGPIINYAISKGIDRLPRPFVIIPGTMSLDDINKIT